MGNASRAFDKKVEKSNKMIFYVSLNYFSYLNDFDSKSL